MMDACSWSTYSLGACSRDRVSGMRYSADVSQGGRGNRVVVGSGCSDRCDIGTSGGRGSSMGRFRRRHGCSRGEVP